MGGASSASVTQIQAPVEGAVFTALAATAGTAAAAWEAGDFPSISSAGIVLMPLPR